MTISPFGDRSTTPRTTFRHISAVPGGAPHPKERALAEDWHRGDAPRPFRLSSGSRRITWRCDDVDVVDAAARVGAHHAVDILPENAFGPVWFDDADPVSFADQVAEVVRAAAVRCARQRAGAKLTDD